jgi:choline kinase
MKALLLAAGRGSRLLPLTDTRPKCLLPIAADLTIFDIQMSALRAHNISDVLLVTGHAADKLMTHAKQNHADLSFTFIHNERYMETGPAYSFWFSRDYFDEGSPLLYLNSDVLFDDSTLDQVLKHPAESTTAIIESEWDEEEVNVVTSASGDITRLGKNIAANESMGEFVGISKLSPLFIKKMLAVAGAFIARDDYQRFAADAINGVVTSGTPLYAVRVDPTRIMEIDTPEDYARAQEVWQPR